MKSCVRVRACDVYALAIEERVVGRRECKRIVFVVLFVSRSHSLLLPFAGATAVACEVVRAGT